MKYLEQKPGPFWWTKNAQYAAYFVRELSGIMIGFTAFIFIAIFFIEIIFLKDDRITTFMVILALIALVSAIIHSSTWLGAMPKILPLQLSATQQKIAYVILIIIWLGLSYILLNTLYQPPTHV